MQLLYQLEKDQEQVLLLEDEILFDGKLSKV